MVGPLQQHLTEGKAYGKAEGETGRRKKETGKKYLPVQKPAGTKGQTAQERAKEILSMSREEQKAKPGQAAGGAEPLRPEQAGFFGADGSHAQELYQARAERGIPAEVRHAAKLPGGSGAVPMEQAAAGGLEQYQSYFEKYGQKPTEEQVQNNRCFRTLGSCGRRTPRRRRPRKKRWRRSEHPHTWASGAEAVDGGPEREHHSAPGAGQGQGNCRS